MSEPLMTSDKKQAVRIRMGEGFASQEPTTVMKHFDDTVAEHGSKNALYQKAAGGNEWKSWTWKEYRDEVDQFAKALLSVGLERFDVITIIGFNAPEWMFSNFGCIAAGGIPAGIYATNKPDACKYILDHSQAKVVVCESVKQVEKFYEISNDLPALKAIVMWGPEELPTDIESKCPVKVYKYADFVALSVNVSDDDLKARSYAWAPGETCSLIYTSGTTGNPKAVMITNDNITWTVKALMTTTPRKKLDSDTVMISYLPLSHIAAQILDMHAPMYVGARLYFAQPDALKGSIATTLKEVRPTVFFGVPRVWEKFYDAMQEVAKASTGLKKMLSTWSKGKMKIYWESREFGEKPVNPFLVGFARTILKKAHVALGLDRVEVCYVAATPIEVKILKYFQTLDLPVLELFGQSECTGPHSINCVWANITGSVGRPMIGTETKIDPETGELCYRGRHIFAGYMDMMDKTTETIDPEGWLHSGDVCKIDDNNDPDIPGQSGFISITGRIKELIITAGGENVPPVLIEDEIKGAMPALANAMVIGDKRKFLSVVLCLQVEIDDDGVPTNKLTGEALHTGNSIGSTATTTDEARNDEKWKEYFDKGLEAANSKATSRAQNVAKWTLISTDFSEKGGELTPTLKLKRSVAAGIHSDAIEAMYA